MNPRIPCKLVAEPLGSAERTVGTTALYNPTEQRQDCTE